MHFFIKENTFVGPKHIGANECVVGDDPVEKNIHITRISNSVTHLHSFQNATTLQIPYPNTMSS